MAVRSRLSSVKLPIPNVVLRPLLIALVVVLPLLVLLILVRRDFQAALGDAVPWLSDEIVNWHQAKTFRTVGLAGGYYTLNEVPALVDLFRFYMHGPVYPVIYGLFATVAGWDFPVVLYVNGLLFAIGMLVVIRTIPFTNRQLGLLALVAATYYPLIIFLPTAMQEPLNVFIGLMLAALFYRALRSQAALPLPLKVAGIVFFALAIFTRMSWGLLLLPYLYLILPPSRVRIPLALLGTGLIGGSIVVLIGRVIPVSDYHMVYHLLAALRENLLSGLNVLLENVRSNFVRYLNVNKPPADIAFTTVFWLVNGGLLLLLRKQRRTPAAGDPSPTLELGFHLYNLLSVLAISFLLYIVGFWGDYRVMSAHLLLTLVLLIAAGRWRLMTAYLLINAALFYPFHLSFQDINGPRFDASNRPNLDSLEPYLAFDPTTDNGWCNSVLVYELELRPANLAVPGGIGLNILLLGRVTDYTTLRSHYLWLDDYSYGVVRDGMGVPELELAVPAELNLPIYLNPNADC